MSHVVTLTRGDKVRLTDSQYDALSPKFEKRLNQLIRIGAVTFNCRDYVRDWYQEDTPVHEVAGGVYNPDDYLPDDAQYNRAGMRYLQLCQLAVKLRHLSSVKNLEKLRAVLPSKIQLNDRELRKVLQIRDEMLARKASRAEVEDADLRQEFAAAHFSVLFASEEDRETKWLIWKSAKVQRDRLDQERLDALVDDIPASHATEPVQDSAVADRALVQQEEEVVVVNADQPESLVDAAAELFHGMLVDDQGIPEELPF